MDNSPRLQNKLIAAASLIGFDAAIAIIQAERDPFQAILAQFQADSDRILANLQASRESRAVQAKAEPSPWPRSGLRQIAKAVKAIGAAPGRKRKYTKRSSYGAKPTSSTHSQMRTQVREKFTLPSPRKLARVSEVRIVDGVSNVLQNGPQTVAGILRDLKVRGYVKDTGEETRAAVMAIIKASPKFARGKAGNSYKLRTNERPKVA